MNSDLDDVNKAIKEVVKSVEPNLKAGMSLIKKLGLLPPNILTPGVLASMFEEDSHAMTDASLVGLKAVGGRKAWLGKTSRIEGGTKLAIVGKGVTFDSGGISIKPAHNMGDMKFDMLGAATVLALANALKEHPCSIEFFGCCAENTFHDNCMRPGDVLRYPNGIKVEVTNTDAEGRLVLADGILAALKNDPDLIITIATLTGSARAALGPATAVFSNHDSVIHDFLLATEEEKELAWGLPIWDIHREAIKAKKGVAHIKNCCDVAGACTAAAFLERFVGDTPWLHLDIAGSAYKDGAPTGAMFKSLYRFITSMEVQNGK